jgi:hypothetical protein
VRIPKISENTTIDEVLNKVGGKVNIESIFLDHDINSVAFFNEIYFCNAVSTDVGDKTQGSIQAITKMTKSELDKPEDPKELEDMLTGFLDHSVEDIIKMMSDRKRHKYSARVITLAMKLLLKDRKGLIEDGIKEGINRASIDLANLATFKSMVMTAPGVFNDKSYNVLKEQSFKTLVDTIVNMPEAVTLKKCEDDLKGVSYPMTDLSSHEKRVKVAAMVIKSLIDNPDCHNPIHVLVETVEGQIEPLIDVFKKNQIGGVREIFIMNFHTRFSIFVSEKIAESINKRMKGEYLTKGTSKVHDVTRAVENAFTWQNVNGGVTIMESADQSEWGPNFDTPMFSYLLKPMRSMLGGLYPYLCSMYALMATKNIELPTTIIKSWVKNPEVESGIKEMHWMKVVCLKNGKFVVKYKTGMGQGICHYMSSLLHVALVHLRSYLMDRVLARRNMIFFEEYAVSSDDRGTVLAISYTAELLKEKTEENLKYQGIRWKTVTPDPNEMMRMHMKINDMLGNVFCILLNKLKTIYHKFLIEFNSRFLTVTHGTEPALKQSLRSCSIPRALSFKSWVDQFYSDIRGYREAGGFPVVCMVMHILNKSFTEDMFAVHGLNNVHELFEIDHSELPYAFGNYPILPPAFSEICGPKLHDYMVYHSCPVAKKLINGMCTFKGFQITSGFEYSGAFNYPSLRISVSNQLLTVQAMLPSLDSLLDLLDDPMEVLYNPGDQIASLIRVGTIVNSLGAKQAFEHLNLAVQFSRMRGAIFGERNILPGLNKEMYFIEAVTEVYNSRGNPNFVDHIYFQFSEVYESILKIRNMRGVTVSSINTNLPTRKVSVVLGYSRNLIHLPINVAVANYFGLSYRENAEYSENELLRSNEIIERILPDLPNDLKAAAEYLGIHRCMVLKTLANYLSNKESLKLSLNTRMFTMASNPYYLLMSDQVNGTDHIRIQSDLFKEYPVVNDVSQFLMDIRDTLVYHKDIEQRDILNLLYSVSWSGKHVLTIINEIIQKPPRLDHSLVVVAAFCMINLGYSDTDVYKFISEYASPPFTFTASMHDRRVKVAAIQKNDRDSMVVMKYEDTNELLPYAFGNMDKKTFMVLSEYLRPLEGVAKEKHVYLGHEWAKVEYKSDKSISLHSNISPVGIQVYKRPQYPLAPRSYRHLNASKVFRDHKHMIIINNESGLELHKLVLSTPSARESKLRFLNVEGFSSPQLVLTDTFWSYLSYCPGTGFRSISQYIAVMGNAQTEIIIPEKLEDSLKPVINLLKELKVRVFIKKNTLKSKEGSIEIINEMIESESSSSSSEEASEIMGYVDRIMTLQIDHEELMSTFASGLLSKANEEFDAEDLFIEKDEEDSELAEISDLRQEEISTLITMLKAKPERHSFIRHLEWSDNICARLFKIINIAWTPGMKLQSSDLLAISFILTKFIVEYSKAIDASIEGGLLDPMIYRYQKLFNGFKYLLNSLFQSSEKCIIIKTAINKGSWEKMTELLTATLSTVKFDMPVTMSEVEALVEKEVTDFIVSRPDNLRLLTMLSVYLKLRKKYVPPKIRPWIGQWWAPYLGEGFFEDTVLIDPEDFITMELFDALKIQA